MYDFKYYMILFPIKAMLVQQKLLKNIFT